MVSRKIILRKNYEREFKRNLKEARVHFIPTLKGRVFVTLRAPDVIKKE
jgi:hypothetical protein